MTSNSTWKMCDRTNGTYLDCPIADMELTEGKEIFLGMHNPSTLNLKVGQISVPNGHFNLEFWNYAEQKFVSVDKVDVLCNDDKAFNKTAIKNCQLYFET